VSRHAGREPAILHEWRRSHARSGKRSGLMHSNRTFSDTCIRPLINARRVDIAIWTPRYSCPLPYRVEEDTRPAHDIVSIGSQISSSRRNCPSSTRIWKGTRIAWCPYCYVANDAALIRADTGYIREVRYCASDPERLPLRAWASGHSCRMAGSPACRLTAVLLCKPVVTLHERPSDLLACLIADCGDGDIFAALRRHARKASRR